MINIFKKNVYKENGVMGKKRERILNTVMVFVCLIIMSTFTVSPAVPLLICIVWITFNIFYFGYRKINEMNNFCNLSNSDWDLYKNRNLIHYSHILDDQVGKETLEIKAHRSPKTNFRLPKKYRKEGFVWFHLSRENDKNEPTIDSFLNAHAFEGDSRRQKIIVNLSSIPKGRVFIEKRTGFILVIDDLSIEGEIVEDFKWYNKDIYVYFTIRKTVKQIAVIFYNLYIQKIASFEEKIYKRKLKKI